MKTTRTRLLAVAGALVLTGGLLAGCGTDEPKAESSAVAADRAVVAEEAWVRATTGSKDPSMTAAFMVLDNGSDAEVTVTGAESDVASMTQIHDMVTVDGKMVMQELKDGLVLAPHRGALLQPGGRHIMLMGLDRELAPGDEVTFTLTTSAGQQLEVTAPVKEFTEEEGHYHEPGTAEHGH